MWAVIGKRRAIGNFRVAADGCASEALRRAQRRGCRQAPSRTNTANGLHDGPQRGARVRTRTVKARVTAPLTALWRIRLWEVAAAVRVRPRGSAMLLRAERHDGHSCASTECPRRGREVMAALMAAVSFPLLPPDSSDGGATPMIVVAVAGHDAAAGPHVADN